MRYVKKEKKLRTELNKPIKIGDSIIKEGSFISIFDEEKEGRILIEKSIKIDSKEGIPFIVKKGSYIEIEEKKEDSKEKIDEDSVSKWGDYYNVIYSNYFNSPFFINLSSLDNSFSVKNCGQQILKSLDEDSLSFVNSKGLTSLELTGLRDAIVTDYDVELNGFKIMTRNYVFYATF